MSPFLTNNSNQISRIHQHATHLCRPEPNQTFKSARIKTASLQVSPRQPSELIQHFPSKHIKYRKLNYTELNFLLPYTPMNRLPIIIITIALVLAGCSTTPDENFHQSTYEGYPCGENCAVFEKGYVNAEAQNLTNQDQCALFPKEQQLGCRAAVAEFQIEQRALERARNLRF